MPTRTETSTDAAGIVQCSKYSGSQWVDDSTDADQRRQTLVRLASVSMSEE